jgi:hypothetical protein
MTRWSSGGSALVDDRRGPACLAFATRTTRSGRSAAHASTCGPPPDPPLTPKRSKPSLVCKRAYVGDLVDHATAMVSIRHPIPRTIVRDEAHAQLGVQLLAWPPNKTAAWRAMQREDREPLWITPDRECERPTVRRLERPQRLAHPSSMRRAVTPPEASARESFAFVTTNPRRGPHATLMRVESDGLAGR